MFDDLGLTITAWDDVTAANTALVTANEANVGEATTISLIGSGPGPILSNGLPLDDVYYLAIRARDDVGLVEQALGDS